MKNFKDIVETIFQMEEDLDLFNQKIDGVYFWELIRFSVVSQIALQTGVYDNNIQKVNRDSKYIKQYLLNIVDGTIGKNPFFAPECDILFWGHPRRKLLEDGFWWDLYSDPIIDYLSPEYKCLLLESADYNEHYTPCKTSNIQYLDLPLFCAGLMRRVKAKITKNKINQDEKIFLEHIQKYIFKHFDIWIDLKTMARYQLIGNKTSIQVFNEVLKRIKPKIVIFTAGYARSDVIGACKINKIKTVELQHGNLSRYHLGYSCYENKEKSKYKYSPDYLLTFGDYWKKIVDCTITNNSVVSVGYPFFEQEALKYAYNTKEGQILFLSQWTISEKLSKFAVELSKNANFPLTIIFKLHPWECKGWEEKLPWLKNSNIKVIDKEETPFYKILSQSKVVVGVYSTAIYEGLGLGVNTYLVDLPGIEYMKDVIESGYVTVVKTVKELTEKIEHIDQKEIHHDYFFKSNSLENIKNFIDEIYNSR